MRFIPKRNVCSPSMSWKPSAHGAAGKNLHNSKLRITFDSLGINTSHGRYPYKAISQYTHCYRVIGQTYLLKENENV
jgi:hypothetical protein